MKKNIKNYSKDEDVIKFTPLETHTSKDVYLNLRSKANINSDIVAVLDPNTKIRVLGTNGEWSSVQAGNKIGYIITDYIEDK